LFTEYALELANIDIYFEPKTVVKKQKAVPVSFFAFLIGFLIGGLVVLILLEKKYTALPKVHFKTLQAPSKRRLRGKKR